MAVYPDNIRIAQMLLEQQGRINELEAALAEAEHALAGIWRAAFTVRPTLYEPYPDAPETSPWQRWVERPAREAHDVAMKLRRLLRVTGQAGGEPQ